MHKHTYVSVHIYIYIYIYIVAFHVRTCMRACVAPSSARQRSEASTTNFCTTNAGSVFQACYMTEYDMLVHNMLCCIILYHTT